ncbi:tetrapyrrole-binding protein, chloroplastic [Euphorbia lathyris]|uniref:tetrapyrrole-binding protein, chloroplastic n=1 Tax=Euphorbia lathyris TaxID=212925 RepID=UPI0033134A02
MATHHHHLHSLHHHRRLRHHHLIKFQPLDSSNSISSSIFLKPPPTSSLSSLSLSISSSSSSTTSTTPSTSTTFTLGLLQQHLSAQNFRQADEETRRLLIVLAGEAAVKRGYVFFSEVKFISEEDLKAIDELWRKYSENKFGYSVQKRIWMSKAKKDFSNFFIKVGWMKKLDTEIEQFNYRAFPNEFIWELNDDTPEGHLPLTNALRGTQLLKCIFNHPAFEDEIEEEDEDEGAGGGDGDGGLRASSRLLSKKVFNTDYGF